MAATNYTPISLYYSTTATTAPLAANLVNGELGLNITDGKLYYKDNAGVVKLLASNAATTNVSTLSFGSTGLTPSTATSGAITVAGTLITSNGGTGLSTYTAGDLLYYATGTALSKLAIGTNGQVLTSSGTAPQYVAQSTLSVGTATTATNVAGGAAGSLIYQTAAATTSSLALGTTNYVLTAGASAPQYVAQSTLSVGSATTATNVAGGTAGSLIYQSGVATTTTLALGTTNYVLTAGASAPQYVAQSTLSVGTATNVAGGAVGSLIYQTGAGATAFLSGNTTTTPQFVTSTGTGSAAQAPTLTSSTGTGSVVLATSPTLVTPALGTPSALIGTNITGTASGLSIGGTATTATNVAGGAAGSLVYQTAAATTSTLALGTSGYILTAGASAPAYIQTLPAANGGTGFSTYATGDLIYASAANTLSKLTAGTNGYVLTLASGVPTWAAASSSGVTSFSAGTTGFTPSTATTGAVTLAGTLATTNGGTGLTSFTANGIPYASSTSALATGSALTFNGTNLTTTGSATAARFIPTSATVPANGMYLVSSNVLGFAANTTRVMTISGLGSGVNGGVSIGSSLASTTSLLEVNLTSMGGFGTGTPTATNALGIYNSGGTWAPGYAVISNVNANSLRSIIIDLYDGESAGTVGTATTLYIEGPPLPSVNGAGTTITNPYSLYVNSGVSYFKGTVQNNIVRNIVNFDTPPGFYSASGTTTSVNTLSGTANIHYFGTPTIATTGAVSTVTTANTLFINGAPIAGANVTITNAYALYVNSGSSYFGGAVAASGGTLTASYGSGNKLIVSGAVSQAAWTTTGPAISVAAGTYTSSAGLTGTVTASSFAQPTFAATTAAQTVTNAATLYIAAAPANGTNVTITNPYALYVAAGASFFGGAVTLNSGGALSGTFTGTPTFSGAVALTGSPTITNLTLAAGTASLAPLVMTSGTSLTSPVAGAIEFDGSTFFSTDDVTDGRGYIPSVHFFRLTSDGSAITTIANFFGTSAVSLDNNIFYEIEAYLYFTKTTAGTATFTMTFSNAPVNNNAHYVGTPVGGVGTVGTAQTAAIAKSTATAGALPATGSLTTAVNHQYVLRSMFQANATTGGTINLQVTSSAGSITPLTGSYFKVTRLPATNTGAFS